MSLPFRLMLFRPPNSLDFVQRPDHFGHLLSPGLGTGNLIYDQHEPHESARFLRLND